ncbi:MAG: hypothetical protein AAFN70_13985, partial [Planctomycetota bacterium]
MIEAGERMQLTYPTSNIIGHSFSYRTREFVVCDIRDLFEDPLTIEDFYRRPMLKRSRYLLRGRDVETDEWRQFYAGNSIELSAPGDLYIAEYKHGVMVRILFGPYKDTAKDRNRMAYVLQPLSRCG